MYVCIYLGKYILVTFIFIHFKIVCSADYEPLLKLVAKLLETYLVKAEEQESEIIGKVMQLMLCILDGLSSTCNMVAISRVSQEWAPVFKLRNSRYFIMISVYILGSLFYSS